MRDPDEGVDADGLVVTGVSAGRIPKVFRPLVQECAARLVDALGDRLHAVHLYGSVATGQAVAGRSDLDLALVMAGQPTTDPAQVLGPLADPALVRGIGTGTVSLTTLTAGDRAAWVERAFMDTSTVRIVGHPLPGLPVRPRADLALARGFAGGLLERLPAIAAGRVGEPTTTGRRLLMTAAMLAAVEQRTWSTDRAFGAAALPDDPAASLTYDHVDSAGARFGEPVPVTAVAALAGAVMRRWPDQAPG